MDTRARITSSLNALASAEKSVVAFASKIGVSKQTAGNWLKGRNTPDIEMIAKISEVFGVSVSDIFGGYAGAEQLGDASVVYIEVPLFGSIAAGTPIEMVPIADEFPIPSVLKAKYPKAFLLKVKGNSMNRRIPNGSYALVDPTQVDVVDGKPYAVCVNGYEATIKRVVKLANGIELDPDSTDPTYHPVVYDYGKEDTEEITIIGRVVWITMPYNYEL